DEVSQAANALLELGVRKGDRVAVYLPMIAEAARVLSGAWGKWGGGLR
ncbi:AMP-binding protein, partial [Kitasatospora sp. NPDC086791]